MATRTIQIQPKTIQGNIGISDTQFVIENFVGLDGNVILQADIGGVNDVLYGTFEPNTIREEAFSAKILSNIGTTVTFECTRGLIGKHPYGTGGVAFPHDAGSKVVFSNNPNLFNKFIAKDNTEVVTGDIQVPTPAGSSSVVPRSYVNAEDAIINATIAALDAQNVKITGNQTVGGVKTFSSAPKVPDAIDDDEPFTKGQFDAAVQAAAANASETVKGVVQEATQAQVTNGTETGSTGARLFLNPKHTKATSAGVGDAGKIPKLNDEGKLDSSFLISTVGGDGSDKDVTISSGTTTLTKDMYYNNLTVNGTGTLVTAGFRIYVRNICEVDLTGGGGGITCSGGNGGNGGNGSGSNAGIAGTAGAGTATGTLPGSPAGKVGGVGGFSNSPSVGSATGGTSGDNRAISLGANGAAGGTGGIGGTGSSGGGAGGAAGIKTGTVITQPRNYTWANNLFQFASSSATSVERYTSSAGSGSGGGGNGWGNTAGIGAGGGGGGSGGAGGLLYIEAFRLILTGIGAIKANGGNGGNGGTAFASGNGGAVNGAGGGGGSGGVLIAVYYSKTGTGTITATGGTGGTGSNAGGAGNAGTIIEIKAK
jgi:hypothetical protein